MTFLLLRWNVVDCFQLKRQTQSDFLFSKRVGIYTIRKKTENWQKILLSHLIDKHNKGGSNLSVDDFIQN